MSIIPEPLKIYVVGGSQHVGTPPAPAPTMCARCTALGGLLLAREAELAALREWLAQRASMGAESPIRYGNNLPECAGGLAYFNLGIGPIGPARTFREAVDSAAGIVK